MPNFSFKCLIAVALFFHTASVLRAQSDSLWSTAPQIELSGFADVFYAWDFNQPEENRQDFLFNHNRHNAVNLNTAMLKMAVSHARYRANIALHTGTYAVDNYAAEPPALRPLMEANVGISLSARGKTWIDAGIFPSHLGFESALSIENPTLTRSLVAENSPYFLAGAKLSHQFTDWLQLGVVYCNGWQRITRVPGNSAPGLGAQLVLTPNEELSINYSFFAGTDDPDSTRRMRYFHNIYAQWRPSEKWGMIAGVDIGTQQTEKSSIYYNYWYGATLILHYRLHKNWKIAARGEYYDDREGVIIDTGIPLGFRTSGVSLNVDYSPTPIVALRLEGRGFISPEAIFENGNDRSRQNIFVVGSLAIHFSRSLR